MKKFLALAAFAAVILSSCSKSEGGTYVQAIVTVCGDKEERCTLNLDDNTVLVPENLTTNPYAKECRALTQYLDKGEAQPTGEQSKSYRKVSLIRIDSVLTKSLAPNLGEVQNDLVYGTAPIDLYKSWLTVVEDGYVTIHFTGRWGFTGIAHTINLVKDTDDDDPCHFELRHNYNGDVVDPYRYRDGIAAFNIKEKLEEGKSSYDITLTYTSHSGIKKNVMFNYIPGTSVVLGTETADSQVVGNGNYIN